MTRTTFEHEGLSHQPDPRVAAAARAESRVLLTLDIEFADVRKYPPGSHPGIVLLRTSIPGAPAIHDLVLHVLASVPEADLIGATTVAEQGRIRIRRAP